MGRTVKGQQHAQVTIINDPDRWSVQAASLGVATNAASPMARGIRDRGFQLLAGFGLNGNRFAGDTLPHLPIHAAQQPALTPSQYNVGIGAMVSGQPGLPNSGSSTPTASLSWMSGIPQSLGS